MKKWYAISILSVDNYTGESLNILMIRPAYSKDEAIGMGFTEAGKKFPANGNKVIALKIPEHNPNLNLDVKN